MKIYEKMTVGQIVTDNFNAAKIFDKYGIDYCCHGFITLSEAVENAGADYKEVLHALQNLQSQVSENIEFRNWPLDLLIDYILKIYHRNIRSQGPEIQKLLYKVSQVHGDHHPELHQIRELFERSIKDLYIHLEKEEKILFPYVYEMTEVKEKHKPLPGLHCGSITIPMSVMMNEHESEGERYREIEQLTGNYTPPMDACHSYRSLYEKLKTFDEMLHQHIHLENNIVFPKAVDLEQELNSLHAQ